MEQSFTHFMSLLDFSYYSEKQYWKILKKQYKQILNF